MDPWLGRRPGAPPPGRVRLDTDAAMPALYSPSANQRFRLLLLLVAVLVVALPVGLMAWVRAPFTTGQAEPLPQPLSFDHRHHISDEGIDCRYCHATVERAPTAGMPTTARCMGCHSQVWNDSPLLSPVRGSYFSGAPIPWRRVYQLPDFVYFDHSIHLAKGVGCESCHGRVDEMAAVYQVPPLTMGWCLDCHRNPTPHLRPREELTTMGWEPRGDRAELGRELARSYQVRSLTYCTTCHR